MLTLLAATAAALAPPARPQPQAEANARIERPGIANGKQWERTPRSSRREVVIRDEHGQPVVVRVIDYQ